MTLSLGISPCPNDVFIFAGMILGYVDVGDLDFTVQFEDVETLNQLANRGKLDAAKISCANFLNCSDTYEMLECGGALGRGVGPLLLSNRSAMDPAQKILSPGRFTTANFLLNFYLDRAMEKHYLPFDSLYAELLGNAPAQGVVIHEKRFTYAKDGLTLTQDLGEYWEARTGYPIPLGMLVARRELGIKTEMERIARESLTWSYNNFDRAFALCQNHAQDLDPKVVKAHIDLYVNDYSRDLGFEGRAAIDFFLKRQRELLSM